MHHNIPATPTKPMPTANPLYLPEWKGDHLDIWTPLLDPCEDHFLTHVEAVTEVAKIKCRVEAEGDEWPGTYRVTPTSTGRYIHGTKTQEGCVEA